ncbi:MAG: transketolase [Gemmatimonadetes bacterium]|nr:transketolase [Gemmatimonadota bacterium]
MDRTVETRRRYGREGKAEPRNRPRDLSTWPIEDLCVTTMRTLAMDAVQKADSGHPGTPMALAPLAFVLWDRIMRYDPRDPDWFDRDRFVLSAGHACMLQYAALHLTGYDLALDEIRRFRQWDSKAPGHPEVERTPGVETTTGPLGQGIMNSVGMAIAEAHLAAVFNRPGHEVVDHRTFAICSDGDLMEGASHEAASLAGHLKLGKLVWIYDNNHITIEGDTALAYSDDVARRFEAYGWHVQDVGERANDLDALTEALNTACDETERPSLIIVRSHIAWGAPEKQDTAAAHGSPLGEDEVRATKRRYGWPENETFLVPPGVREHMGRAVERGRALHAAWDEKMAAFRQAHPELAARFEAARIGDLPEGWDRDIPTFSAEEGPMATRAASGKVMEALAPRLPWLIGGAADLAGSTKTLLPDTKDFEAPSPGGRNFHWGIREHGMAAASTGMALHGGVRPFASTFFIFTDYARPAIRLAALTRQPVVYVLTHDSIGLGEDGPTHQPVEHLASFRAMPNVYVMRPADANEVAFAWRVALERRDGPTLLVLSRQKLRVLDRRDGLASAEGVRRGGYVLAAERGERPDLILLASGSEVEIALQARERLKQDGIDARVVSLACWELFRAQPASYREQVLPPDVKARLAVEAASPFGWEAWVGDAGAVIGVDRFGASAPWKEIYEHYGLTAEHVVRRGRSLVSSPVRDERPYEEEHHE